MIFLHFSGFKQRLTMRSNLDHNVYNSNVFRSVDLLNFIYFSVYKQRLTMRSKLGHNFHNSKVFSSVN